jgi:flagellar basal body P-ring protein FlgI
VERAVDTGFETSDTLRWNLFTADFLTAQRVRDAINRRWPGMASSEDAVSISLRLPPVPIRAPLMAAIEMLDVTPPMPRRASSSTAAPAQWSSTARCACRPPPSPWQAGGAHR